MLTAVVTRGAHIEINLVAAAEGDHEATIDCAFPEENAAGETICGDGPSPIAPEAKELAWGAGSFIVLALLMRFVLYPRLKAGMDARYAHIRDGHEQATTMRAAARAEVAEYESALATVKAEAHGRVEAARQTLEAERAERLAGVNEEIAAKRAAAAEAAREARAAAHGDITTAVSEVTERTIELATGRRPDPGVVRAAVDASLSAGVAS